MHVLTQLGSQIDDRIDHQLAGAVIGHVAAPARAIDRHFLRRKHVGFVSAAAEGIHVGMFDEDKHVWQWLSLLARDQLLLQRKGREIVHAAEICVNQHNKLLSSCSAPFKLLRSPQLSNHEATDGRALEIAGIGAERSLSGPAARLLSPRRGWGGGPSRHRLIDRDWKGRPAVVTQPHGL